MLGDYCDVYLTHDSMSVRKAHNSGRNHLRNVVDYYQRTSPTPIPSKSSPRRDLLTSPPLQRSATKRPSPSSTPSRRPTPPRARPTRTPCSRRTSPATASPRSPSPAGRRPRSRPAGCRLLSLAGRSVCPTLPRPSLCLPSITRLGFHGWVHPVLTRHSSPRRHQPPAPAPLPHEGRPRKPPLPAPAPGRHAVPSPRRGGHATPPRFPRHAAPAGRLPPRSVAAWRWLRAARAVASRWGLRASWCAAGWAPWVYEG